MRAIRSARAAAGGAQAPRSGDFAQPVALCAIVDGDRIPSRCFGEPLYVAASDRRGAKAFEALGKTLCRNWQVGITPVAFDEAPRLAALVPIGHVLALRLLRPEYAVALAHGLRAGARVRCTRCLPRATPQPRAAA